MLIPRLLVFDPDDYTARVLQDMLASSGFVAPIVLDDAVLCAEVDRHRPDIVVVNFHFGRAGLLDTVARLRRAAPGCAVLALAAPGAALRDLQDWSARTGSIDAIVEKPVSGERIDAALRALAAGRPARRADGQARAPVQARFAELAVLVTELRRPLGVLPQLQPAEFFERVEALNAEHARQVRAADGSVLRLGGGGLVATFAGPARAHLALRCALRLLGAHAVSAADLELAVGLCSGLAVTGFLHSGGAGQYEVAGAAVELAARLSRAAPAGCALADRDTLISAGATQPHVRQQPVRVPGVESAVVCLDPAAAPHAALGALAEPEHRP